MYVCADGWMDKWMDGWIDGWMNEWMDRWMDVHMYVCMHVCTYICMYVHTYIRTYARTYVCMYVRTYRCMDGCVDGYVPVCKRCAGDNLSLGITSYIQYIQCSMFTECGIVGCWPLCSMMVWQTCWLCDRFPNTLRQSFLSSLLSPSNKSRNTGQQERNKQNQIFQRNYVLVFNYFVSTSPLNVISMWYLTTQMALTWVLANSTEANQIAPPVTLTLTLLPAPPHPLTFP